jgi:hypothetical protein
MKTYVTFGQTHRHEIDGKVFDRDCVAVINCSSAEEGRRLAFELFDRKFCFEYPDYYFDYDSMKFYPRGFIEAN